MANDGDQMFQLSCVCLDCVSETDGLNVIIKILRDHNLNAQSPYAKMAEMNSNKILHEYIIS